MGTMGLGWDAEAENVVVELLAVSDTAFDSSVILDDAEEGPDAVRVFLSRSRPSSSPPVHSGSSPPGAHPVRSATTPDPQGHLCVRTNGLPPRRAVRGRRPSRDEPDS